MASVYTCIQAGGEVLYIGFHIVAAITSPAISRLIVEARISNNTSNYFYFCNTNKSIILSFIYIICLDHSSSSLCKAS